VREAFDAFNRGDLDWMREHLAEDVTWHVGGHNRFTGDYQGPDAVLELFQRTCRATDDTLRFRPNDVIADAHHAVALGEGSAKNSKGEHAECNFAIVFHAVDGKASEVWGLSDIGQSTDEFFDSLPG
jgi:uncharacterized protein